MTRTRRTVFVVIALALVSLATLIATSYQRTISVARERVATGSHVIETQCGTIEYALAGEGPPVLVVHGAGGGFDQGMAFGQELVQRGFKVIAVSRFGYLRTPLPADASAESQADAHACLLDALNITNAAVIGASAGAPSSMQFALRHPERSTALVLLVPLAFAPRPEGVPSPPSPLLEIIFDTALRFDFLFWASTQLARDTMIKTILATPSEVVHEASHAEQRRVEQILHTILPVSPRRLGLLNDAAVATALPRYELEQVRAPTLAISLVDDRFDTYEGAQYSAEHIPHARFVGYPRGGHVWVGHHEEIVKEIVNFLRVNLASPSPARLRDRRHWLLTGEGR